MRSVVRERTTSEWVVRRIVGVVPVCALARVGPDQYSGAVERVDWRAVATGIAILGALALIAFAAWRGLATRPKVGLEELIGRRALAKVDFVADSEGFSGSIAVGGARWHAVSQAPVSRGETVEIEAVLFSPTRLRVKRPRR